MEKIKGKVVSNGIAFGELKHINKAIDVKQLVGNRTSIAKSDNIQSELCLFQKASYNVRDYYMVLCDKARNQQSDNNEEVADVFEGLSLLATDEELVANIQIDIKEKLYTAEYAVYTASRNIMTSLELLEDEYIRQRARDIEEVSDKIIVKILELKDCNKYINIDNMNKLSLNDDLPHILIADKVLPEIITSENSTNIKGVVARECPDNSHAAIIARIKGIPVMAGINIDALKENDYAIIDDKDNMLIINPDEDTRNYYDHLIKDNEETKNTFEKYKDMKAITKEGKHIKVCANVSSLDDIKAAIENGAEGIGLLRTEVLFMNRETEPTEEEQFEIYSEAAKMLEDKPLTIRVFDGGMDKPLKFMKTLDTIVSGGIEENNLDFNSRGIRLLLRNVNLLKNQLRAIYRAAVYGNISVMFPMISCIEEVSSIQGILKEVKVELQTEHILFRDIKIGIMIETPSAVTNSDILTKDIDFVGIGTNDLIQYTFGVDRTCEDCIKLNCNDYEKIFGMIKMTADNAHKNNCKVSVCGELAGELKFTDKFIEAGVDELSVIPPKILLVRKQIIS